MNNINKHAESAKVYTAEKTYNFWIEIDKQAFIKNIGIVKKFININTTEKKILSLVVKADAYGHGLKEIGLLAANNINIDYFCTFNLSEALKLRSIGTTKPILVLAFIDQPIELALRQNIDLTIGSLEVAIQANNIAKILNLKANVHLKIDTGLSRLGITFDNFNEFENIINFPNLNIIGAFTHFAEADNLDTGFTKIQIDRFNNAINFLRTVGCNPKFIHCANSSAIVHIQNTTDNFVRIGGLAYGLTKSKEIDNLILEKTGELPEQIFSLKTKIIQIKKIKSGEYVGYSRTFKAAQNMVIALLPIGYSDGYPRALSNKGIAYVKNIAVNIVGRIAMNMIMIDVTNVPANIGDIVELVGNKKGILIRNIAQASNTIDYEISTRFSLKTF